MFGFLSLIPLPWKLGAAGVIIIALLLWYRSQLNKAYEKGHQEGVANGIEQIEKQKTEEWKAKEAELTARRQELDTQAQSLSDERALLSKTRLIAKSDFNSSLDKLRGDLQQKGTDVARIPSSELIKSIKDQLEVLRGVTRPNP